MTTTETTSDRLWRLANRAEERAAMAATNLDRPTADRLLDRAESLADQAREAQRLGR
jgi:hypothetical protein